VSGSRSNTVVVVDGVRRSNKQKRCLWSHAVPTRRAARESIAPSSRIRKGRQPTIVDAELDDGRRSVDMIDQSKQSGKWRTSPSTRTAGEFVDALAVIGVDDESGELVGDKQGYCPDERHSDGEASCHRHGATTAGEMMNWCVATADEPTDYGNQRAKRMRRCEDRLRRMRCRCGEVHALNQEQAGRRPVFRNATAADGLKEKQMRFSVPAVHAGRLGFGRRSEIERVDEIV